MDAPLLNIVVSKKMIFLSFYDLESGNLNIFIILTLHIGKAGEIGVFKVFFNTQMEKFEMVEGISQTS